MASMVKEKKHNGNGHEASQAVKKFRAKDQDVFNMDVLPVPAVVTDREFNIRCVNAAGAEIMSSTKEALLGKKCFDILKLPVCNTPNCLARKVYADGKECSGEVTIKGGPKGEWYYRCYCSPVKDSSGNIVGVIEYLTDASRELIYALEAGKVFMDIGKGIEATFDYKKYDGVLRKAAKGMNILVDGFRGALASYQELIEKIGAGETNLKDWDSLYTQGVWAKGTQKRKEIIGIINAVTTQIESLVQSAGEGQLNVRGDASGFTGVWADMINGVNKVLDAVVNPLKAVSDLLVQQSNYDLTVQLEGEFKGDLVVLRDAAIRALRHQVESMQLLKRISAELAESGTDLSQASQQAQQAAQQIANASQQVATGAGDQATALQDTMKAIDQLIRAIDQIARGAQEQSQLIEKNVNMVGQISGSITQVSSNTAQAASNARSATETARKGTDMVQKTIKGMEDIRATIDVVSEKVSTLGTRSREIGKIVATINDIADQTNLLALNAAIEAARAGEQGRGFAVVADEVRKLAERSSTSTKEIAELISGIQMGVSQTISAMDKGTEQIANGYELATRAGQSLDEILKQSGDMGVQVEQISAAAQQLNAMSTEMVKLSDNISSIIEENTEVTTSMHETAKQVAKSVEEVAGVAEENSAATEQVSAAAKQISAGSQQVIASGNSLLKMSKEFEQLLATYKLEE